MTFGNDRMMKNNVCAVLVLALLVTSTVFSADKLYDGFKNPPMSARPIVRWSWDGNTPGEREVQSRLDFFKKAGFGGVEIDPGEDANAKLFKFAADAAKKRGMLVDLSLGSTLGGRFILPAEQGRKITIGKKEFAGPTTAIVKLSDLANVSEPNSKLMFLRLVLTGLPRFVSSQELIEKIRPDGTVAIDINDANIYTLYAGVQNLVTTRGGTPALNQLDKQAADKYFNNISARFGPALGGKLGNSIHAVVCPAFEPDAANWTGDFTQQFQKRYDYDITKYLPVILDNNLPNARYRFQDTIRRTRFDFYSALTGLYQERFIASFRDFCKDNGVVSRIPASSVDILDSCSVPLDIFQGDASACSGDETRCRAWDKITSSTANLTDKPLVIGETMAGAAANPKSLEKSDDLALISGINQFICPSSLADDFGSRADRDARLSYLFQNARHQARIAILCPAADMWSDYRPYKSKMADSSWYLFPLWYALSQNGYTVDYVSEKIFPQTTFEDGKLHFGPHTYDAVIVPDVYSMEFLTAKALRFFAENGGRVAFIGQPPQTGTGFKDLLRRGLAVDVTMRHFNQSDPNRVVSAPEPNKNTENLLTWTSGLMKAIHVLPTVEIFPPSDKLLFVHYLYEGRDIFYFVNTDNAAPVSFRARFDAAGKIPSVWNPDTGERKKFAYKGKPDDLNITIKSADSLLLVFDPDKKAKPAKPGS